MQFHFGDVLHNSDHKRKPQHQQAYKYKVQRAVMQGSNNQVPGIAQKAARNRRRQGAANIRSAGLYLANIHQMAPAGTHPKIRPATHLSTP